MHVHPVALTPISSRVPSTGLSFGSQTRLAFTLLKLHGSINWYYSGFDSPHGDTVYASGNLLWRPTPINAVGSEIEAAELTDKSPLIVPPTAVKNRFYGNDLLRAQWRMAAQALKESDQIDAIGYSFPESDLLVRSLISTNFDGRKINVINRSDVTDKTRSVLAEGSDAKVKHYTAPEYIAKLPDLYVSCVRESRTHADGIRQTVYSLSQLTSDQLVDVECPLCPGNTLIRHTKLSGGSIPGFSCNCCACYWQGEGDLHFKRSGQTICKVT